MVRPRNLVQRTAAHTSISIFPGQVHIRDTVTDADTGDEPRLPLRCLAWTRELNRRLVIVLACLAALGGCATSLATNDSAPASERSTSPNPTSPASQGFSNFGSSEPHDFGSGEIGRASCRERV